MRSFDALMALASKQTEASQIALAKETQLREAREKSKRLEEERKEKERIRLEKERLAKQKLEDERREKKLLEDRQRKIAERLAAAELARKQQEVNPTAASSSSRLNSRPKPSANHRSTTVSSSSTPANHLQDPEEKRMLEREEKKARARARLFGEPVSAHKKPANSRANNTHSSQRLTSASKGTPPQRGTTFGNKTPRTLSTSSTPLTARQKIEKQFSATERKPLNQYKKDRRTIEEIELDMKRKKSSNLIGTNSLSKKTQQLSLGLDFVDQRRPTSPLKSVVNTSLSKDSHIKSSSEFVSTSKRRLSGPSAAPPSKRPIGSNSATRTTTTTSGKANETQRTVGGSKTLLGSHSHSHLNSSRKLHIEQSEDEESSESDFSDQDVHVAPSIRDEIWKIMGKDRKHYTAKPIFSDDDGSDDMEADVDDVLEEEGRAAHLARLEDQREQERLRQHELEKKKRLSQNRLSK